MKAAKDEGRIDKALTLTPANLKKWRIDVDQAKVPRNKASGRYIHLSSFLKVQSRAHGGAWFGAYWFTTAVLVPLRSARREKLADPCFTAPTAMTAGGPEQGGPGGAGQWRAGRRAHHQLNWRPGATN